MEYLQIFSYYRSFKIIILCLSHSQDYISLAVRQTVPRVQSTEPLCVSRVGLEVAVSEFTLLIFAPVASSYSVISGATWDVKSIGGDWRSVDILWNWNL